MNRLALNPEGNGSWILYDYLNNTWNQGIVQSSGNLGLGTTNPQYALDVNGTAGFTQPIFVGSPTTSAQAATKGYVDTAVLSNGAWTLNSSNLYNPNSGNVGIGTTSPSVNLQVGAIGGGAAKSGVTIFAPSTDIEARYLYLGYPATPARIMTDATKPLTFSFNGSENIRIDRTGNVGIGTTSPNAPLQVGANVTTFGTGNFTINKPVGALIAAPVGASGTIVTGLLIDGYPTAAYNQGIALEFGLSNPTYGHYTSRIVHYGYASNTVGSRLQRNALHSDRRVEQWHFYERIRSGWHQPNVAWLCP